MTVGGRRASESIGFCREAFDECWDKAKRNLLKSKTGVEPRLLAVRGPLKGHVIPLPQGEYWVGRQATNDLQLEDNAVSRRHCLFVRSGEGCTLKDLDSRNGTFVTGTPVTEQQLTPGDEIRIGGSVFCFLVDPNAGLPPKADLYIQHPRAATRRIALSFVGRIYDPAAFGPGAARSAHAAPRQHHAAFLSRAARHHVRFGGGDSPQPPDFFAAGFDSRLPRGYLHPGLASFPGALRSDAAAPNPQVLERLAGACRGLAGGACR